MMAVLRRLLGLHSAQQHAEEHKKEEDRKLQYERIKSGLHEAAQRVHYIEIESQLRARKHERDHHE